jgi:IclR family KDG regulon transcriptional repressor
VARVVPAVARALKVLEMFLDGSQSISVPEIVARLGLPRSTTHELVQTLLACGYLAQLENQPHRYVLGLRVFELGSIYAAKLDLVTEGLQVAQKIVATCDETVQMAIRDGTEVVYVAKVDCSHTVRLASAVGRRLPAHCTGLGKMLLSSIPDEKLVELYGNAEQLPGMTPNSITSLSQLLRELAMVRARGLAYDDCESNVDVRCVAAPVYNHKNKMVAAISISVPISRMSMNRQDELAVLIQQGATDLSRRLGYRPATTFDAHPAETQQVLEVL